VAFARDGTLSVAGPDDRLRTYPVPARCASTAISRTAVALICYFPATGDSPYLLDRASGRITPVPLPFPTPRAQISALGAKWAQLDYIVPSEDGIHSDDRRALLNPTTGQTVDLSRADPTAATGTSTWTPKSPRERSAGPSPGRATATPARLSCNGERSPAADNGSSSRTPPASPSFSAADGGPSDASTQNALSSPATAMWPSSATASSATSPGTRGGRSFWSACPAGAAGAPGGHEARASCSPQPDVA